jgi:hypothetical protein
MRNLLDELENWGDWPAAWRPEAGDILVGKVVRYDRGFTPYSEVRTVTVEKDDGERVAVWLSSTVLLNEFAKQKPKPGERVGLKYLGMHPDRGYHRYKLVVDRDEPLEFTPLGGEAKVAVGADDEDAPF